MGIKIGIAVAVDHGDLDRVIALTRFEKPILL
jgi:hypothetical protein